jgi:hypothetical protein
LNKAAILIKDFFNPLPSPKILINKLWTTPVRHITGRQLQKIIEIVLKEVKISRFMFGLFIDEQDVEKEILFWLVFIDYYNGTYPLQEIDRILICELTTKGIDENFGEISKKYFDRISKSKGKQANPNNAYRFHLEYLQNTMLDAIYNNEIKL